jgi:hypothetical protein
MIIDDRQDAQAPSCPYCKASPLRYGSNINTISTGAVISLLWCATCGALLSAQCLGVQPPQIVPSSLIRN